MTMSLRTMTKFLQRSALALLSPMTMASCERPTASITDASWNAWPFMPTQVIDGPIEVSAGVGNSGVTGARLALEIRFANPGTTSVRVNHGACAFGVRLYRHGAATTSPVWDNRPAEFGCIELLYTLSVPAQSSVAREVASFPNTYFNTRIPPGRYDVYVTWRPAYDAAVRIEKATELTVPVR